MPVHELNSDLQENKTLKRALKSKHVAGINTLRTSDADLGF